MKRVTFPKLTIFMFATKDIEGLYKLAKTLSEKGREKEAANILIKAHHLINSEK